MALILSVCSSFSLYNFKIPEQEALVLFFKIYYCSLNTDNRFNFANNDNRFNPSQKWKEWVFFLSYHFHLLNYCVEEESKRTLKAPWKCVWVLTGPTFPFKCSIYFDFFILLACWQ